MADPLVKVVIDCSTGEATVEPLTEQDKDELALWRADIAQEAAAKAAAGREHA